MEIGVILAISGAALAIIFGGIGSSLGVGMVGKAGAGLVAEDAKYFGQSLLLQALPGSQAIYGFLAAILILQGIGLIGGNVKDVSFYQGLALLFASLPVSLTCLISAIFQGKVAASALSIVAKDPARGGQGIILASLVETFAILGLLISILMITGIKIA